MQCACTIVSTLACPTLLYFSTLSHKRHKLYVLILSKTFVWNFSDFKKKLVRYDQKMYIGLHVMYPLFLCDSNKIWIFSTVFSKNTQIQNFVTIRLVGDELFLADRRTDMTKLIFAFSNFENALKCINYSTQKYWQFCILIQIVDAYWLVRNRTWWIFTRIPIFKMLKTFSCEFWKQVIIKQVSCLIRDFELIRPSIHVSSYMSSSTISAYFSQFF
jgi:hypothetical protein